MDDDRELVDLATEIRDSDIALELAREIRHRESLETLVISLLDRIALLEVKMRQHELYHNQAHWFRS